MNSDLDLLQPYPFEKLTQLKAGVTPPKNLPHIALSVGESTHEPPAFVLQTLADHLPKLANYPLTQGLDELRQTLADWLSKRFQLNANSLTAEHHVLPVSGTREAIFSFTQACVNASPTARVVMPNPFYQIYEGATLLAGAQPYFLNCDAVRGYQPDFDSVPEHIWQDCELLFICSPGNPTGAVLGLETLQSLIRLADRYDFVIASDECYSELYFDEQQPPVGLLQACAAMGRNDYQRCVVFHSLSKRSNLPGLRSGFIAGDAEILRRYLAFRTYQGCALPVPVQLASIAAWNDEDHVFQNRELYRQKFSAVMAIFDGALQVDMPTAGFYLWLATPIDDADFARKLFAQQNITVVPGQYLARSTTAGNPGSGYVRMALVAPLPECIEAAQRIKAFVQSLAGEGIE